MKTSTLLAAIALALMPSLALAVRCSEGMPATTASSCIEGAVWDEAKGQCVLQPTS